MSDTGIFIFGLFTVLLLALGVVFSVYEVHHYGDHPRH